MWLVNPYRFAVAAAYDSDAQAYITAVEAADAQALETGVKDAINAFVVGCKADGIWTAIKACCILAGARTRAGSLVPVVGTAPTSFGTAGGWDYNRKTGTAGNGTDNYLNSNRSNSAEPQNSKSLSVFATTRNTEDIARAYIGATFTTGTGGYSQLLSTATANKLFARLHDVTTTASTGNLHASNGFFGISRGNSSNYIMRGSGINETISVASNPPNPGNIFVFARNTDNVANLFSNARLASYFIGENLNLALLGTRVTTLINAFAAAIP